MTISLSDNNPRISYSVSAGVTQTSFTVPFEFFDLDDLNVYVDGVQKTKTTHYTLASGGSGSTGSITMSVTGATGGSTVVITRDIDLERTTDFQTSGPFNIASLNTELDRFTAIAADLQDGVDRSLRLTDFDAAANLTLPDVNTRKGKTLAFNASTGAVEAGPSTSDVQTVSATAADIATLADIEDGTNATNAIQTVAGISGNVSTVAGISGNVTTVAGISSNVTTVANDTTDIGTVASNISSVNTNATNITAIQNASANATTATTKASEAATSASNASTSESNASTSASTAATKAAEASTSASNASTSETNAATSATNAATSATAAAASQTAAAASAASAASAFDNFDDTYLGAKTSNPTVDNDGDPLTEGDLYFNTTANEMRVYDGANWIAATSAGNVSLILYEYTATAGQTTFSGSDDNSATLSYTADNIQVVMNGIVLDPSDFTATNGTSVVLASGAALNDIVNIYAFKSFTTADMVSASAGGTFSGNVTVNARLDVDNIRIDGNTISSADTNGDITLDPDGTGDVIVASGNVGIGTSSPTIASSGGGVHIQDGTQAALRLDHYLNGGFEIQSSSGTLNFYSTAASEERLRITSDGSVGIGTGSPDSPLHVIGDGKFKGSGETKIRFQNDTTGTGSNDGSFVGVFGGTDGMALFNYEATPMRFFTSNAERMRLTGTGTYTGSLILDKTSAGSPSATGIDISVYNGEANGIAISKNSTAWGTCLYLHRTFGVGDGNLIEFAHDTVTEGTITVSGGTVQLNGAHLSRWSQAADGNRITGLLRGTLMTNLDQMAVWSHDEVLWTSEDELPDGVSVGDVKTAAFTEDNEQLNCMAVSSVEGDPNVAGVFVDWDETDDFNDMHVAMTGDFVIRIASGTTVARGDLLMSAGDGTAKPQGDDIVRSKTIAKVTSTNVSHTYDDGSYLVPCVLMAC